jgi:hypothetical protein
MGERKRQNVRANGRYGFEMIFRNHLPKQHQENFQRDIMDAILVYTCLIKRGVESEIALSWEQSNEQCSYWKQDINHVARLMAEMESLFPLVLTDQVKEGLLEAERNAQYV